MSLRALRHGLLDVSLQRSGGVGPSLADSTFGLPVRDAMRCAASDRSGPPLVTGLGVLRAGACIGGDDRVRVS